MGKLKVPLLLWEVFRYQEVKKLTDLFLPFLAMVHCGYSISFTHRLWASPARLALMSGIWVDMTAFQFLKRDFKM